ncbi:hypothetical protein NEOLEDRAFT_1140856 [Neolentinus lepideus HHB14362 ss-1]|uniref:60S ribosomal protein L36 n=1 Tax=Neolentinus lepideus HHB14362 ss-1 TaxID=1314782 RepID=A0A165P1J7_9AGAM|nr:hypothetical protein NEOLEDRAFT_1140856 [Neolentinus lepideus HHB14362 ss-1]
MARTNLRYGSNHGHPTTAIEKTVRPSHRKGIQSKKTTFVRSVIREVAGFSPYERRIMELLRNSKVSIMLRVVMWGSWHLWMVVCLRALNGRVVKKGRVVAGKIYRRISVLCHTPATRFRGVGSVLRTRRYINLGADNKSYLRTRKPES